MGEFQEELKDFFGENMNILFRADFKCQVQQKPTLTNITFHGGVNDIGGNKFLVESKDTKVFMDFGMSFSQEGQFFSQFLGPRTSNSLNDLFDEQLVILLNQILQT